MKIILVTLHSQNNNFGSVLQSYSLYHFIKENGYSVELLDYRPYYSNGALNWSKYLMKIGINMFFLPYYLIRKKRFDSIINSQKMTKRYKSFSQLQKEVPKADVFLIGSDQVWNTKYLCGKDPIYYLDFINTDCKMSYAASLGSYIESVDQLQELKRKISAFRFVSFREDKSVAQLLSVDFKRAEYVLDPVFLHTKDYYRQIQSQIIEKGYILAYIIHKDPFIEKVIDYVRVKLNKPVIQIGGFRSKCMSNKYPRAAGPKDFLSYIDQADFIITSSFHGLAFSHIYNKQFIVVMPDDNTLRLENILDTAGTDNRKVTSLDEIDNLLNINIDYESVNQRIEKKKEESISYLLNAFKSFENERNL